MGRGNLPAGVETPDSGIHRPAAAGTKRVSGYYGNYPTRALCVVGNDPANQTIQIRHEDVTSVDVQQAGQLLWKHHAIRIQTNDQTLKIPDGTDTDLEAAARYIRTAAYEERCAAGERLLECCDVVATSNGFTTVDAVLDAAKTRFQSAVDWGERYDPIQRGRKPVWSSPTPVSRELTGRYDSRNRSQRLSDSSVMRGQPR